MRPLDLPQISADAAPEPAGDRNLVEQLGFDLDDDAWLRQVRAYDSPPPLGRLGGFELLAEIGRGGQGVVFKARQPGTERFVAIKRLGAGAFADANAMARFRREMKAAAALDHPGIVTVYGSELIDNQPLMLMQWIDGVPVDHWAAGSHKQKGNREPGSGNRLTGTGKPGRRPVREVLQLFVQVCEAVQHAHQRGIIHRDLKPSNILVDAADQPHVLDFGLAKLLSPDDSGADTLTHAGFVGTPAYAAPEVLRADGAAVDVRADVYGLGVVLYQSLTGALPFEALQPLPALIDDIQNRDPRPPSALGATANREIDAIVLKALEKEPWRRYQSVEALAADVQRYLDGEPVWAHPPSAAYRVGKLLRRHAALSLASSLVLAAIVTLSVVSTAQAVRQRELRAEAEKHKRAAQHEADIQRETAQFTLAILGGITRRASPSTKSISTASIAQVVDRAFVDHRPDVQPEALLEMHHHAARILHAVREHDRVIEHRRAALDLARMLHGELGAQTIDARVRLASALALADRHAEADAAARETVQASERAFGRLSARTAGALRILARSLRRSGRLAESASVLRDAVQILDRLAAEAAPDAVADVDVAVRMLVRVELAQTSQLLGGDQEAVTLYQEALDVFERQNQVRPMRTRDAALVGEELGALLYRQGNFVAAEPILARAVEQRLGAEGLHFSRTATALRWHGRALHALGRYSEAAGQYERALIWFEHDARNVHVTACLRFEMAAALFAARRDDEGRRQLLRAVTRGQEPELSSGADASARQVEAALRQNDFALTEALLPALGEQRWLMDTSLLSADAVSEPEGAAPGDTDGIAPDVPLPEPAEG